MRRTRRPPRDAADLSAHLWPYVRLLRELPRDRLEATPPYRALADACLDERRVYVSAAALQLSPDDAPDALAAEVARVAPCESPPGFVFRDLPALFDALPPLYAEAGWEERARQLTAARDAMLAAAEMDDAQERLEGLDLLADGSPERHSLAEPPEPLSP
jgi:hypothetical protein